jgi:hypothetical protein
MVRIVRTNQKTIKLLNESELVPAKRMLNGTDKTNSCQEDPFSYSRLLGLQVRFNLSATPEAICLLRLFDRDLPDRIQIGNRFTRRSEPQVVPV